MKQFGRQFNQARREQGFKSQEHLDAFYLYMDHGAGCLECQKPGCSIAIDDGYQPTQNRCDTANSLFFEYCDL